MPGLWAWDVWKWDKCLSTPVGTNFLVRAQAIMEVGGSPMYTMTEDYALGMELKKYGWHCRYVQEYLAIGEAPHEVRNMYQQRSRWTKVSKGPQNPCLHIGMSTTEGLVPCIT